MEDLKTWVWEGIKAAGRFLVAALIPVAIDAGLKAVEIWLLGVETLTIGPTEKWMLSMALVAVDKALHSWKKSTEGKSYTATAGWKGLLGF